MTLPPGLTEATARRYEARAAERERNEQLIKGGRPWEADTPDRVAKFLARRGYTTRQAEATEALGIGRPRAATFAAEETQVGLERVLGVNNLMGVAFLAQGLAVARTVARIRIGESNGRTLGYGTGFLVSPRLLMTNHHVLGERRTVPFSQAEFGYELSFDGSFETSNHFTLAPSEFYFSDAALDYVLIAVTPTDRDERELKSRGWNPLIEEEGKAIVGQWLNIIQHPNGEPKQLALRDNQMVDIFEPFMHYRADTAPGSSGSPVFNDRWEVVALHHAGVPEKRNGTILTLDGHPWRPEMGEHRIKWIANEGARISRIVAHLKKQQMDAAQRRLFDECFTVPPRAVESALAPSAPMPAPSTSEVRIAPDGTATWTFPISVSVRVGGQTVTENVSPAPPPIPASIPSPNGGRPDEGDAPSVVAAAQAALGARRDVMKVRLGYKFENGWITKQRALVVTVRQKQPRSRLSEAGIEPLPSTFRGLPIDVTHPSIEDLLVEARGTGVLEAALGTAGIGEEITYKPPAGVPLSPVSENMRVIAHVSPDAGWPLLRSFLKETSKTLTIGMYDFGAPHVLDALKALKKPAFKKLKLVMQAGESVGGGTKKDDLEDQEVVDALEKTFGARFENAWVSIGTVRGWVAYSYHIKVAVRDSEAFWLSSGNWQSSNQPEAEPLKEKPAKAKWLNQYNREWHAVVEHEGLAKLFETYLLHDFANNATERTEEGIILPEVLIPEAALFPVALERAIRTRYFSPFDKTRKFNVQPLLTPDNYGDQVRELLEHAEREILLQNQTFNAPKDGQEGLRSLMDLLLEKQRAGLDVRIIFRDFDSKTRENLEALQDFGFSTDSIKVQKHCHTKGIIVDRDKVLLGSHNLSNAGVTENRDASLLFADADLANYFAEIFEFDWQNLATQRLQSESFAIELAEPTEPTPEGMVRVTWKEFMEMR